MGPVSKVFGDVISSHSGSQGRGVCTGGKSQNDCHTLNQEGSCYLHVVPSWWSINFISMYLCWVDHGDCQGCLNAVFVIGGSVCPSLSGDVAIIVDGVCIPPPPPPPPWDDWGKSYSAQQFPMFDDVPQFLYLKLMCLASMVNHHRLLTTLCWQVGNYSKTKRCCISWIIIPIALLLLTRGPPGSFMGVPPHVAVLQELQSLKIKQQSLIGNFISKVKTAIEECDLASGSLSEQRL